MQSGLKIVFWISVVLSILGFFVLGDSTEIYLIAAAFAFSAIFIRIRLYRLIAIILFCADLMVAYGVHQEEKVWMIRIETHMKEMQARMEKKS
jgi:hypothetical protein